MKVKLLKREDIDVRKWDECVLNSPNSMHYAMIWHLDAVSPGWQGVVYGDYMAVMPLPFERKARIPVILQPFLCQQLGIFSSEKLNIETLQSFYLMLKRNHPVLYNINFFNKPLLPSGLKLKRLPNTELYLNRSYDELKGAFSKNTRRNILKATKEVSISEEILPDDSMFNFIFENLRFSYSPSEQRIFRDIVLKSFKRKEGILLACRNNNGELLSIGFFVIHKNRITFLGSSSSKEGYVKQAAFLIFDKIIEKYSGRDSILDFEGSKNEGVARFYKGFGGKPTEYGQVSNRSFEVYKKGVEKARRLIKLFNN